MPNMRPRSSAGALLLAVLLPFAACAPARTPSPPAPGGNAGTVAAETAEPGRLKVLFLGDDALHRPVERLRDMATPMLDRGIALYFTTDTADLNPETLARYDALLVYSNHEHLGQQQERALLDYVATGGGLVALHSASGSFLNSPAYLALVGGQFRSHRSGVFSTRIAAADHEIMRGFAGFESWDETYVHQNHNDENRTVLSYRGDEPWTWVRTHGDGRMFYTAWGHDGRTWTNPGFQDLLERGIRWAAGQDVQQALATRTISNPLRYEVLDVPFPPPYEVRLEYEQAEGRSMDRGANYPLFFDHQLPLSPTAAIERMIVPAGFRVELFASEPDIVNPIDMTWDERGRLWVIESLEYPYPRQLWPDGGGKDRITIVEDTDGDGRADEFTVFADGLNIPTSIAFANGGVIVHQAPQTLFLQDTDGDDRADTREVLFEGWSQSDTHAGPNHLRYGLDNWIWGVQGYSGFTGTIGGEAHTFRMGVYRFRRDGSQLEFLRRTNNNTWGFGFNERGDAFISTANGNPSTYLPFSQRLNTLLPELEPALTERIADTDRIIMLNNKFRQVDFVGAYTAGAGHGIYTARTWPREYWNRSAFVSEPTGRLIGEFRIDPAGSSYRARHPRNLIASDDQWFAPVVAEVGPDGHVWIADWYNYILQHNAESNRQRAVPGNAYANPLRDRHHGRIYRVVYEDAP
ncbi:MAG: PVC-type heme-binding CxxCH protein, partial [Gemmatimonadota bacterium]